MVSHTNFRKCEIPLDPRGFEIWLDKWDLIRFSY
jgi:hypothetical protein